MCVPIWKVLWYLFIAQNLNKLNVLVIFIIYQYISHCDFAEIDFRRLALAPASWRIFVYSNHKTLGINVESLNKNSSDIFLESKNKNMSIFHKIYTKTNTYCIFIKKVSFYLNINFIFYNKELHLRTIRCKYIGST